MTTPIRPATKNDLSRIAEIFVFNNRINYLPIFKDEFYSFGDLQVVSSIDTFFGTPEVLAQTYVYDDGLIRGFLQIAGTEIMKLYVDPFFQSHGIGRALIQYAIEAHHASCLWVLEKNTRALSFYRRHGFTPTGEQTFEEGTTEHLLKLHRPILETPDLLLDKAKESDWSDMLKNVWSHPESSRYMLWSPTETEDAARIRIQKTIEFQKTHTTWLVYEKSTGQAIGFAGVEELSPGAFHEAGICLGPVYTGKGYGKQILQCLIQYCRDVHGAREFHASARAENLPSNKLIVSLGFTQTAAEPKTDPRTGQPYTLLRYRLPLA